MKYLTRFITAMALVAVLFSTTPTIAQASSWHKGTPKAIKGYWHDKTTTFYFGGTQLWHRMNGWSIEGSHRYRWPSHGFYKMQYRVSGKRYLLRGYFSQTGKRTTMRVMRSKVNHNKIYFAYSGDTYFPLYRGVK